MSDSLRRVFAIVRGDFLLRFRRPSTLVVFLLLSAFAYLWVPDPATGRTLLQINGQRAIYNSAALGMATASVGMIFVGLFGFYVISNAIRRDVVSRCGLVIASTPMRSVEYLLGKFLGNVAFLATFLAGFMLSSMAMQIVRGEAAFEPLVFVRQYLLLTPPTLVFVSAIAVLFEAIPWLSGKLGDVLYFFLWMAASGVVISQDARTGAIGWWKYVDLSGFGFMIEQLQQKLHTESVSIGASPFDPTKPTIVFNGLSLPPAWVWPRIVSMLFPLAFLPLAALFFHRFDPVRTRRTAEKGRRNWWGRLQMLFKPVTRRAVAVLARPGRGKSLAAAIWTDAMLTLTLSPIAFLAFVGLSVAALVVGRALATLPFTFLALALVIADSGTRDLRAGTTAMLYAAPRLRENFVWWKLGSTCVLAIMFCAVPLALSASVSPARCGAILLGAIFVGTLALALGVLTRNPKTFLVGFLSFWYVTLNDKGASPALDFAGFYGGATTRTLAIYGSLTLGAVVLAQTTHRWRLARS
ncbi:MAG: ABC transporter permease [Chthoniobacterales bacterium]